MLIQFLVGLLALLGFAVVRPGTNIVIQDQPPSRSAPTDTGVWFVCGLSEKGPLAATFIKSMTEYATLYGSRVSYGILYDVLDAFFREGGRTACISRVVGPAALQSTHDLLTGATVSLTVKAKNPGVWGDSLKVGVVAGQGASTYQIKVTDASDNVLEQSGDLDTQADAVNWSNASNLVAITLGVGTNPPDIVAPAALTGGTDDRNNIVDAQWQTALDRFTKDLGPGQVSYPGRTTSTAQTQLLDHAQPNNRVALIDLADSGTKATLTTAATALRGLDARFGATFAPWAIIPGIVAGTTRQIPFSAIAAGLMARNDVMHSANVPAAGENGYSRYCLGLTQPAWSNEDRTLLNEAGVNVAIMRGSSVLLYGYRTLVNPSTDSNWVALGNSRLIMQLAARCDEIMESHVFDEIDGQGHLFSVIDGELTGMLQEFYTGGSLYGATPEEAFFVDTGETVNTPATIANNEIHATVSVKTSPMGEYVELDLVKVALTDSIA